MKRVHLPHGTEAENRCLSASVVQHQRGERGEEAAAAAEAGEISFYGEP